MSFTRALHMAIMAALGLAFLLPLIWVGISAIRPEQEIFRYVSPVSWQTIWPSNPTAENLIGLWFSPFAVAIFNSIFVAAVTVIAGLFVSALAAFALAVIPFPGRNVVFTCMIVSFLIPFDAIAQPLHGIMRGLNLQNSYAGLILPGIGNGLAVFLLRQFFLGIPAELSEAGRVDGMTWFGVFWRLYLPLSMPALVSAGLILFIFQWQAYLWPLIIAPADKYKVAAVALAQFSTSYDVKFGLMFAGSMLVALIPMVILVFFQRQFTSSIAATGSKE